MELRNKPYLCQKQLMKSYTLKTFTANFDPEEDRIRLDCSLIIDKQTQIYFTNRLSKIFINELVNQIDQITFNKGSHDLAHRFAVSSREVQKPVEISPQNTEKWLTRSIDFIQLEKTIRIIFKDNDANAIHLEGDEILLRNILDIFYKIFNSAGWDTTIFPTWIDSIKSETNSSLFIH